MGPRSARSLDDVLIIGGGGAGLRAAIRDAGGTTIDGKLLGEVTGIDGAPLDIDRPSVVASPSDSSWSCSAAPPMTGPRTVVPRVKAGRSRRPVSRVQR